MYILITCIYVQCTYLWTIDNFSKHYVLYEFQLVTIAGLTLTRIYIIYTAHFVTYFTFIVNNTRYVSRIRK